MKIKKLSFALSIATATLLVIGSTAFGQEDTNNSGMGHMMNSGNGIESETTME